MADEPNKPTRLSIEERNNTSWIVRFQDGKIDGIAVRELYEAAAVLIDRASPVMIVDFDGVKHVGSGMLGMLVTAMKKMRQAGGQMAVVTADPLVRQEFRLTHLDRVLDLHEDVASAIARWS